MDHVGVDHQLPSQGFNMGIKERASGNIVTSQKNQVSSALYWDDVQVGDSVQISRNGHIEYTGHVDDRTADGNVVWIKTNLGRRRLFHVADGVELAWSSM
jgi:hypothetical protein